MASAPTVVTSRRRQHELLRSWTGWPLTSILIDPTEVAKVREAGWSGTHRREPETGERIVGMTDGLGFGVDDSSHNPGELIPWSELEAIARAVPDEVREQLVAFRARWRQHQSAYPRFTASAVAIGCGPIVGGEPLTMRQEAYVREHKTFEVSGVLPAWQQQRAELDAERLGLHCRAMGLSAGSEAGDLPRAARRPAARGGHVPRRQCSRGAGRLRNPRVRRGRAPTRTDVPDDGADFFTVYEGDSDGLPHAVSDHPTQETVQRALEDRQGAGECQAADPVSDDRAASSARPALLPTAPSTAGPGDAAARSVRGPAVEVLTGSSAVSIAIQSNLM